MSTVLRLCIGGICEADAARLRECLSAAEFQGWEIADEGYQALVADPRVPAATQLLRERPLGTVVVLVLSPGERQLPGTISLVRPFQEADLRGVIERVEAVIAKRASVMANAAKMGEAIRSEAESRRRQSEALQSMSSLQDLATCFRDQLSKELAAIIHVGPQVFHLFPRHGRYWSEASVYSLQQYRGLSPLSIRVNIPGTVDETRLKAGGYLADFACYLGFHAGNGRPLPWVDPEVLNRVTRWPLFLGQNKASGLSRIAALLSMGAYNVRDIIAQTNATEQEVYDFLNACSLAGWLQVQGTTRKSNVLRVVTARNTTAAPKRPPIQRSLLARIRQRMGIAS